MFWIMNFTSYSRNDRLVASVWRHFCSWVATVGVVLVGSYWWGNGLYSGSLAEDFVIMGAIFVMVKEES